MNKLEKAKNKFLERYCVRIVGSDYVEKKLDDLIELACEEKDEEIEKLKNEIKEKEIPSWSKREDSKYQTPIY